MNTRQTLLSLASILAIAGCSSPTTQPEKPNQLPQITSQAVRLRITSPLMPPDRMRAEGVVGSAASRLFIDQDGTVTGVEKISGSMQLWYYIKPALMRVKFAPTSKDDVGPWEVVVGITTEELPGSVTGLSSLSTTPKNTPISGNIQGMGPMDGQPTGTAKMYIADVKTKAGSTH